MSGKTLDEPVQAHSATRPAAWRQVLWSRALPWLSTLGLLMLWQLVSALGLVSAYALPSPAKVAMAGWALTLDGQLPAAIGASLLRVIMGTALGLVIGLSAGLGAGYYRLGELVIDRPLQMLRAVPFNALLPLFIVMLGIGETMKVALIAVGVLVPIYLNTFSGVRNVDLKLVEVGMIYKVPRYLIAYKVLFLGALPSILTGLRFSLAIAWIALVTSETVNANAGIGYILAQAQRFVRTDRVFLCIIIYAALGILTDWLVRLLEGRLLRWRRSYGGQ